MNALSTNTPQLNGYICDYFEFILISCHVPIFMFLRSYSYTNWPNDDFDIEISFKIDSSEIIHRFLFLTIYHGISLFLFNAFQYLLNSMLAYWIACFAVKRLHHQSTSIFQSCKIHLNTAFNVLQIVNMATVSVYTF